ncbi:MAG: AAA family ATPase, partial [Pseudomonadota bacterium]
MTSSDILSQFDQLSAQLNHARDALSQVIFGQDQVLTLSMATLVAGGHGLLVGAPGVAKTLLVNTVAHTLGLSAKRVQFTPDLMPGDILGSEVLEEGSDGARAFRFIAGPIFCQLLMADEINRA